MKCFEDLTFCDDFMFCKVMANPEVCRGVLEIILGRKIAEAKLVISTQESIQNAYAAKGIRLDVMADDESHTRYNVEMQVQLVRALPKRARYYSGQMDLNLLRQGMEYEELPDTIVIFLCMFDPFGRGRCRYTFQRQCQEEEDLYLEEGTKIVFVNAGGNTEEADPLLREFLTYLKCPEQVSGDGGALVQKLEQEVEKVKKDYQSREAYMKLELMMRDREREGFERGRQSGEQSGFARGEQSERQKIVKSLIDFIKPEEIASRLGLPLEEVLRLSRNQK